MKQKRYYLQLGKPELQALQKYSVWFKRFMDEHKGKISDVPRQLEATDVEANFVEVSFSKKKLAIQFVVEAHAHLFLIEQTLRDQGLGALLLGKAPHVFFPPIHE